MTLLRNALVAIGLFALPEAAQAQAIAAEAPAAPVAAAMASSAQIRIPAGTLVFVEITETLGSKISAREQTFGLRLAEPIAINGQTVVPAGANGGGEVIDAQPAGFGGRQGKLVVSGRFLEINGERVRIRAMTLTGVGRDNAPGALGASFVIGPLALLVEGGEIEIPIGARAAARIASDVFIPTTSNLPVETAQQPTTNGEGTP